ncbi:BMP family protein [Leucobacter aridicollis]|uniref:BMP family protein n=1 Tax=Leucobacter aridicollis TaxID=283878 RepID=UPI0021682114|nr:BMP family protein [Leucobacter aridicollis]MCS3427098.1 hypothetical protein [Leucobacter aridicollis]
MSEFELRPAPTREVPDWRRLEVTMQRFGDRIAEGIAKANELKTDIEVDTARCIAHTLGRALGRESALAEFGRTGEGIYERIRDEYLGLYRDSNAAAWVVDLVDQLGSYLIRHYHPDAGSTDRRDKLPRQIDRILVPTVVRVGEATSVVHIPGDYDSAAIATLEDTLGELEFEDDSALQAFLTLPDVNAMSGDIAQDFHDNFVGSFAGEEDALESLCDINQREQDVREFAEERGLYVDQVSVSYDHLRDETNDTFDLVEHRGATHAFWK